MKISQNRTYSSFLRATKGIFRKNPVLGMGLAMPFVVAGTSSLQTAAGFSIAAFLTLIPVGLLMPFIMEKLSEKYKWLQYPICVMISALFLVPTRIVVSDISPALMDSVGVYFSLMCVSTLLFDTAEKSCKKEDISDTLLDLLRIWLGVTLVMVAVGIFREVVGYGTIWGKPLTFMKVRLPVVQISGIGFIFLGFFGAFWRKIHRAIIEIHLWSVNYGDDFKRKMAKLSEKNEKPKKSKKRRKDEKEDLDLWEKSVRNDNISELLENKKGKEQK